MYNNIGTNAIMKALLGQKHINPMSYDQERASDPMLNMGYNFMRGTGNPNNTTSGAVRDAGEKILGAVLAGYQGKKYNEKESNLQKQWEQIYGDGDLQGINERFTFMGADFDPKIKQAIRAMNAKDSVEQKIRQREDERTAYQRSLDDKNFSFKQEQLNLAKQNQAWQRERYNQEINLAKQQAQNPKLIYDEKALEQLEKKQARQEQAESAANNVLGAIGQVKDIMGSYGIGGTGLGHYLNWIPGTLGQDLEKTLDTIKSNVGFDKLQEMRSNSPTGGALGAVSDFENKLLQSTLANLETSQSRKQFLENLQIVEDTYNKIINQGISEENYSNQAPKASSHQSILSIENPRPNRYSANKSMSSRPPISSF